MHLMRRSTVFLVALCCLACFDSSGPTTVFASYSLQDINGRPLPTYFTSGGGLTIVSGGLTLNSNGSAAITQVQQLNNTLSTYTSHYKYTLDNGAITFEATDPCPADAICIGPPTGTIHGNSVSVTIVPVTVDGPIVYNFTHFGPD